MNATEEDKNSGAVQCLLDFFPEEFECDKSDSGSYCWKIISEVTGYIDIEIPFENLQMLRESIETRGVQSITEAVSLAKKFAKVAQKPEWATPTQRYSRWLKTRARRFSPVSATATG